MDTVLEKIDELQKMLESKAPKTRMSKIHLYAEGLKAKLKQVDYALACLEQFTNQSDAAKSTTEENAPSITMQVSFYCDTFWAFLYASLDVLSQIVNQAMALKLDEEKVSFHKVRQKLNGTKYKSKDIFTEYEKCSKTIAFRNLEKYRNCSIHRRQIYLKEDFGGTIETAGYSSTADVGLTVVVRLLCDDPLKTNPKTERKRVIPEYMVDTKKGSCPFS